MHAHHNIVVCRCFLFTWFILVYAVHDLYHIAAKDTSWSDKFSHLKLWIIGIERKNGIQANTKHHQHHIHRHNRNTHTKTVTLKINSECTHSNPEYATLIVLIFKRPSTASTVLTWTIDLRDCNKNTHSSLKYLLLRVKDVFDCPKGVPLQLEHETSTRKSQVWILRSGGQSIWDGKELHPLGFHTYQNKKKRKKKKPFLTIEIKVLFHKKMTK